MKRPGIILMATVLAGCVALFLTHVGAQAPAAPRTTGKVAVCDVVTVFKNYQRAKDLSAEFTKKREKIIEEDKKRIEEIKLLEQVLDALTPDSKQYEANLAKHEQLVISRDAWFQGKTAAAVRWHRTLTQQMYEEILEMVAAVAKEGGFDLVLHKEDVELTSQTTPELLNKIAQRKVLYVNDAIDLTSVVLDRMNRQYELKKK